MLAHLSKSDFKIARDCGTKLYYKKLNYPSTTAEDKYLEMLAEGGFMVEKIARLLFPDGIELPITADSNAAAEETLRALQADQVTLFDATFISSGKLARIDILVKRGMEFQVIEVKAKSYSSTENAAAVADGRLNIFRTKRTGAIDGDWLEYLEDVTFQVHVIQEIYPKARITPFLMLPDKAKTTQIDGLNTYFKLTRVLAPGSNFERLNVEFTGDAERLRSDHFLTQVPVSKEVSELLPSVKENAGKFASSLQPDLAKLATPLNTACKRCEFRAKASDSRDGFLECWGPLGKVTPSILDLFQVGRIGKPADTLIQLGKVSLFDVPKSVLVTAKGEVGENNKRQIIQIDYTQANREWCAPDLATHLKSWLYPLHFIDFETATLAIPYHAGMHPYEEVAFQWSCHSLNSPAAELEHRQWINVADRFPNFTFAESLMDCLGDTGTVLVWATHENTILTRIRKQMTSRGYVNEKLQTWLEILTRRVAGSKSRLIDMNALTRKYYFHPVMKGKTSVKKVCDAVWQSSEELRKLYPKYLRHDGDRVFSPYASLPSLEINGVPVTVAEGTGAVRAYEAMVYGVERDDAELKDRWKKLLLQYCELDTLSMVMVWRHWRRLAELSGTH